MDAHTAEPWYLGEMMVDPGEPGWDGTILAGPDERERQEAQAGGYDPEPWEVARVRSEADARRIVACVNLLAGTKTEVLERLDPARVQRLLVLAHQGGPEGG